MALTLMEAPSEEPISTEEAKEHLRDLSTDHDNEIARVLKAARDYCERSTSRTLRTDVTRLLTFSCWPNNSLLREWHSQFPGPSRWDWREQHHHQRALVLPWPPLRSVSFIKYYDTDGVQQTLASSNYIVELSTNGWGRVTWTVDAVLPSHAIRPDAISLQFVTGYATVDLIPETAIQAIKTKLFELWGRGTDNELKAACECTDRLLSRVDATSYA